MDSVLYAWVGALVPAFVAAIVVDLVKTWLSRRLRGHRSVSSRTPDGQLVRDPHESGRQCREHSTLEIVQPVVLPPHAIDGLYLGTGTGTMELFTLADEQLLSECLQQIAHTALSPSHLHQISNRLRGDALQMSCH